MQTSEWTDTCSSLVLSLLTLGLAQPQLTRIRRPSGQEFLDLLPDDFTDDEYAQLLLDFKEFLAVKNLKDRGDFVDFETLECTPKVNSMLNVKFWLTLMTISAGAVQGWGQPAVRQILFLRHLGQVDPQALPGRLRVWHPRQLLQPPSASPGRRVEPVGRAVLIPGDVQCGERTELQEPQPSPGCPRRNGYFNPPEPELCGEYVECVDGVATPGKCSTGVVWSPPILACTTPGQTGELSLVQISTDTGLWLVEVTVLLRQLS